MGEKRIRKRKPILFYAAEMMISAINKRKVEQDE